METNYYEAYNQDNVELIDLLTTPVECVTENSVKTTQGEYECDILVYATGFSASKTTPFPCPKTVQLTLFPRSHRRLRSHRLPRHRQHKSLRKMEQRTKNLPRTNSQRLPKHVHVYRSASSLREHPPKYRVRGRLDSRLHRVL